MSHTKEPWPTPEYDNADYSSAEWWEIPDTGRIYKEADARRIVACVNACESIPTNVLENVIAGRMLVGSGVQLWMSYTDKKAEVEELKQQRDSYKEVAEAHSSAFQECIRLREELAEAKKQRDELEAELLSAQCQAEHNGQELASLRQRIDDAPVVAWYADDEVFSDTHCVSIDNPVPLISKEDLQK